MKNFRFIPLGGMDEVGKNLFALEIDESILIFDAGNKDPSFQNFGVDKIIPGFKFINDNASKIKGIFISNGHANNIGSLPYIIKKNKFIKIYGSPSTGSMIENEFRKMRVPDFDLTIINSGENIDFGGINVIPFQIAGAIPHSFGFAIRANNKQFIYAVDYMLDDNPRPQHFATDYKTINYLASTKTDLLITDTTKARYHGFSFDKNKGPLVGFKNFIKKAKRVLVTAVFADNVYQVEQLIKETIKNGRKVVIYGRAINESLKFLTANRDLDIRSHLVSFTKINDFDNYVIFASHNSYSLYRKLHNIANDKDDFVKISKEIDVYVAVPPIPGAETFYYQIIDDFYRKGIRARSVDKSLALGQHPFIDDIKKMIDIFKPQNIIPIKGYFRDSISLVSITKELGYQENNTILLDNGEIVTIKNQVLKKVKDKINDVEAIVDGLGIGDIGPNIIKERVQMSDSGVIFIGLLVSENTKQLTSEFTFESIGLTENEEEINIITEKIKEQIAILLPKQPLQNYKYDIKEIKNTLRKKVLNQCRRKLNKEPAVVPIIIMVK